MPMTEQLVYQTDKNSHRKCSVKKAFVKTSQYPQGNTGVGVFFNKVADLQTCNFIKKTLLHRCFPVNIVKFVRASVLNNICVQLILNWAVALKTIPTQ